MTDLSFAVQLGYQVHQDGLVGTRSYLCRWCDKAIVTEMELVRSGLAPAATLVKRLMEHVQTPVLESAGYPGGGYNLHPSPEELAALLRKAIEEAL